MRLISTTLCIAAVILRHSPTVHSQTTAYDPPYPIAPNPCNGATDCTPFEPSPGPYVPPATTVTQIPGTYYGVPPAGNIPSQACPAEPGYYPDQSCLNAGTGYYGMPQEGATTAGGTLNDNSPNSYCQECQPVSVGSNGNYAAGSSYGAGSTYTTPAPSAYGSGSNTGSGTTSFASGTTTSTNSATNSLASSSSSSSSSSASSPTQAVVTTDGQLTQPNNGSLSTYPFHAGANTVDKQTLIITAALTMTVGAMLM